MIEFKNVSFAYGTLATPQSMTDSASEDTVGATESQSPHPMALTLDNVSFTLKPGSRTVVLGHNGSGKSTLANLCNASLFPLSGEV
ncbi:MAG: ATP-binding cassette domain-containing protein, partial [Atopobium sp.]|nr:ATP-binding cassette domain-containing protein [Atopobium sp.]